MRASPLQWAAECSVLEGSDGASDNRPNFSLSHIWNLQGVAIGVAVCWLHHWTLSCLPLYMLFCWFPPDPVFQVGCHQSRSASPAPIEASGGGLSARNTSVSVFTCRVVLSRSSRRRLCC